MHMEQIMVFVCSECLVQVNWSCFPDKVDCASMVCVGVHRIPGRKRAGWGKYGGLLNGVGPMRQ